MQALVEKYRPKTMKQILGQQGDKSGTKKIYAWLMNWHKNQSGQVKHVRQGNDIIFYTFLVFNTI